MHTQTITMLPAEPVLAQLAELSQKLDRALAAAEQGSTPLYLPQGQLCRLYGMTSRTASKHLTLARCRGAIRTITPDLEDGSRCLTLYNVADFEAWLARRSKNTKDEMRNTK